MRTLWPQLRRWCDSSERFALATVVAGSGSVPRAPGAGMAISADGRRFLGAVSAGCLDREVAEAAMKAIRSGEVERLQFGPDASPPWSAGLTCGGLIEVRVEPWWGCDERAEVRAVGEMVCQWLERDEPGVVLSRGAHHLAIGADGEVAGEPTAFGQEVVNAASEHLRAERPPVEWTITGEPVFVRTIRRRPRLIVAGAVDVAVALVALAAEAGFATIVLDPREPFVAAERFTRQPDARRAVWPHRFIPKMQLGGRDAAVVLAHDSKIDDPALMALLGTAVGYIGAMGSQRSHAARLERLLGLGAEEASLARLHGPAGIHLGTPNAAGIAVGILAGILQWQAEDERVRFEAGRREAEIA